MLDMLTKTGGLVCNSSPHILLIPLFLLGFDIWCIKKGTLVFFTILALVLVNIGGLLNFLERVFRGCVLDYWPFFGISHFNLNDLMVVPGLIIILVYAQENPSDRR